MTDLEKRLLDLSLKIAPAERAEWVAAMSVEAHLVPRRDRLRFIAGCVVASTAWRLLTPKAIRQLSQAMLTIACAILTSIALFQSAIFGFSRPSVMLIPALVYGIGAVVTQVWRLRGMVGFACGGIVVSAGFVFAWAFGSLDPPILLQALSLEAVVIMIGFLGAALMAQTVAMRMERSE